MAPNGVIRLGRRPYFFLDAEHKEQVERELVREYFPTQVLMGGMILIFQLIMITLSFVRGNPWNGVRGRLYLSMYLSLFCSTLLFLVAVIWLHVGAPKRADWQRLLSNLYAMLISAWSCGITLLDQMGGNGLSVFSYVLMSLAVFNIMRPWQSAVIFGGSFVLLNTLILYFRDSPVFFRKEPNMFGLVVNSLFIVVLSTLVSITLYRYRMYNHYSHALIHTQYEEISAINERLNRQAQTDQLTQMGNRRFLQEEMERLAALPQEERRVLGMMVDIDYFKQYNDSFGHQAGDDCLRDIAGILMDWAAEEKRAFAVRLGGEEFFLCAFLENGEEGFAKAEALRARIEERLLPRGDLERGCVTVSIGADVQVDWTQIGQDEFLKRCDQALYEAKRSGRNRVVCFSSSEQRPRS